MAHIVAGLRSRRWKHCFWSRQCMQTSQSEAEHNLSRSLFGLDPNVSGISNFTFDKTSHISSEIHRACQNLAKPNELDSLAVDARQELDLRIGAAFTRFQTMRFRTKFTGISEIVSYGMYSTRSAICKRVSFFVWRVGPCQFPTLGFIVDRYWKHKVFKPEDYWGIKVVIEKDDQSASLNWERKRLFDHASCFVLYELCVDNPTATVMQVNSKPTRK